MHVKKFQLVCPKCKHEFSYDNEGYDKRIAQLGVEIKDICNQLGAHKTLPKHEQRARTEWWKRTKYALSQKTDELVRLKAYRKAANEEVNRNKSGCFMAIVRDSVGVEQYHKWLDMAEKELEAYTLASTMGKAYSRSASLSNVTSINKL